MSGRIQKSAIPLMSYSNMPPEFQQAIIIAKQQVRSGLQRRQFSNERGGIGDGPPLPRLPDGSEYIECDVGETREGDRGSRRVVFEVHAKSRQILETYYTGEHYSKFTFFRLV